MDPITMIASAIEVGGFVASLFGGNGPTGAEIHAANMQTQLSNQISGYSQQQDDLRKQAATSDYLSSVRGSMRNAQVARASALAGSVNGGTQQSSGLLGGQGQIAGQAGEQIAQVGGDYYAGQQIFDLNKQITSAQTQYNYWGAKLGQAQQSRPVNPGAALMQLGSSLGNNSDKITNSFAGGSKAVGNIFAGS